MCLLRCVLRFWLVGCFVARCWLRRSFVFVARCSLLLAAFCWLLVVLFRFVPSSVLVRCFPLMPRLVQTRHTRQHNTRISSHHPPPSLSSSRLLVVPTNVFPPLPPTHTQPRRHFTIRGADGTDFEGGVYHGRILVRACACIFDPRRY